MSRPDAKKNITTLVRAYGENRALRDIANLVLVMGNRKVIDGMASGSKQVLESVLKLVDAYDLYGSVAYPKAHTQDDISDIYLLPQRTHGVFVNIALQEPFGLTLIEAAAHGVPIVATTNGGPVDIINTLHNGILVDPTDDKAVGDAILRLLADSQLWEQYALAGRDNINAYSWPAHCIKCLSAIEAEKLKASARPKAAMRKTWSADVTELADAVIAAGGAAAGAGGGAAAAGAADAADTGADRDGVAALRALSDLGPGLQAFAGADAAAAAAPPLPSPGSPGGGGGGGAVPPSPRARLSLDGGPRPLALPPAAAAADALPSPAGAHGAAGAAPAKLAYAVLLLDSRDTLPAAAPLLAARAKALAAVALVSAAASGAPPAVGAAAAAAVGVGVASAYPLQETLDLLSPLGLPPSCVDFVVASCGAQIWYNSAAAAAGAGAAAGGGGAADAFVSEAGYDALVDAGWDRDTAERKLRAVLEERGLLQGLPGAPKGRGGAAAAAPPLSGEVKAGACASHVVVTLRGAEGGAEGGALPPAALAALVARVKRRLRAGGVRAQVCVQLEAGAPPRLHVTPLRAARALALRWLAMQHKVDISRLVFVGCAREAAAGRASFAASDAEDLVAGAQKVFILPPPRAGAAAAAAGAAQAEGEAAEVGAGAAAPGGELPGFPIDLSLYQHDGRVQLLAE